MPTVRLVIGNDIVSIDAGRFTKGLQVNNATLSCAAGVLGSLLNRPISDLTGDSLEARFTTDRQFKWDLSFDAGALAITLEPNIEARIVLRKAGVIFKFKDDTIPRDEDLPLPPPAPARVPPGQAYVSIELQVGLSASGIGGFTSGQFGFKTNAGTDQLFLLAYHHAVPASTKTGDALKAAFQSFVLPYASDSILDLAAGCYSEYEHIGKYSFGAVATFGYSGTLIAGISRQTVATALGTELGKAAFRAKPEFKLGEKTTFGYTHEDAFRVVASAPDDASIGLYYFKMDQNRFNAGFAVEAKVQLNAHATIKETLAQAAMNSVEKLVPDGIPGSQRLTRKLRDKLPTAEMDRAVADVQKRINDFMKTLERRLVIGAGIALERISAHTSLMSYTFNRDSGRAALETAMKGNLRDAVDLPGGSVTPGSFVRDSLTKRISFGLRILGLEASSLDEFVDESDIVYEGEGIFRLRFTLGHKEQSDFFGHRRQVEILFTATAEAMNGGVIRDSDIRMRITLFDKNDDKAAGFTAAAIRASAPQAADLMSSAIRKNPAGAYRVICSIAPSAFGRLVFTPFEKPDRPQTFSHQIEDRDNYESFLRAFNTIYPNHVATFFPELAMQYSDWAQINIAVNDQPYAELNADSRPNRRASGGSGSPGTGYPNWPRNGRLANIPPNSRFAVFNDLEAARQFLNCCENLSTLAHEMDKARTESAFEEILHSMHTLAAQDTAGDFPIFYTKPMLAALCDRMSAGIVRLDVPVEDAPRDEFSVRIDFA